MPVSHFPFKGRYEGDNFSIEEVISSLSAQRLLIGKAVDFLEELDPDFAAERVVIRVISIEEGSLDWNLLVTIWIAYQTGITEKVAGGIEGIMGVDIPDGAEPWVALVTMAVVFWGLQSVYDRVQRRKVRDKEEVPPPAIHIEGSYNTVIQLVADRANTSAEHVDRALTEALTKDRSKVAKAAADFVRPAKRRDEGISIDGAPDVSPDLVREVPSDAEIAKISETEYVPLKGVTLSIRGTDRDSHQAGWRALVEDDDRFPKRLPLILSPAINLEDLADHHRVIATAQVEGDRFVGGKFVPRRIHLYEYRPVSE